MSLFHLTMFFVFVATQLKTSQAINCYRCTGTNNTSLFQCNEWLDNDIDLQPESCDDVYDAKYCVKHIGRFEANAIKCFQCSASESLNCSDGMIHMSDLEPASCDHVFEAYYCVKSTGLAGGVGAKRFCSSLDLGNYCNYVRQPGDTLEFYRTCIFTCTGDGCNGATAMNPTILLLAPLLVAVFHYLIP